MKALAVVRAVVFVLLAAYTLYAMPWKYIDLVFFPRDGVLLATGDVLKALRTLTVATWLAVAWIGVDAWLGLALQRRQREAPSGAPGAAK
ncbi:MAG: hypothetical protein WCK73_15915 [Deltaproteobacteria bacterium]